MRTLSQAKVRLQREVWLVCSNERRRSARAKTALYLPYVGHEWDKDYGKCLNPACKSVVTPHSNPSPPGTTPQIVLEKCMLPANLSDMYDMKALGVQATRREPPWSDEKSLKFMA